MVQIEGKEVVFKNGKHVAFDFLVKKTIEIDDIVIILITQDDNKVIYNENVFGYNIHGEFLWRVAKRNVFLGRGDDCPFTDIMQNKENELMLHNWCDFGYIVVPKTGEILRVYEHR
jgi:hypothetical protein